MPCNLKFSHKNPSLANMGVGFYDYLAELSQLATGGVTMPHG